MAVEVDAHARPVQAGGNLLDMGRLAGAVIAGDQHAAIARKAGEDGKRRLAVEKIVGVEIRHMLVRLGIGRDFEIAVDAENLADRDFHVGQGGPFDGCFSHDSSVASSRRPRVFGSAGGVWCRLSRNRRT